MLISLITDEHICSLTLPEKVAGRYGLCDDEDKASQRNPYFVMEAEEGKWVMSSTHRARLVGEGVEGKPGRERLTLQAPFVCEARISDEGKAIVLVEPITEDRKAFYKYVVRDGITMRVGRRASSDIRFKSAMVSDHHATFAYEGGIWRVRDEASTNGTFVNGRRLHGGSVQLKSGDSVWIAGLSIVVGSNFVSCNNPDGMVECNQRMLRPFASEKRVLAEDEEPGVKREPDFFYRSPRFYRSAEEFELRIDAPPARQKAEEMPVAYMIGPSLTMGMAMVFSAGVMLYNTIVNGTSVLSSLPMAVMAVTMLLGMVLWPILSRRYQGKKEARDEDRRQARYREYLDGLRSKIADEMAVQSQIARDNNPSVVTCMNRAIDHDRSLWERSVHHDDFMSVRIGKGTAELKAKIDFPNQPFSVEEDDLRDALALLKSEPCDLTNVPISFSLRKEKMTGIIGERGRVLPFVRGILAQLVTLCGYDELKICFVVDPAEYDQWEFVRWFPHCWNADMTQRYFVSSAEEMRELALFMEPLISSRSHKDIVATTQGDSSEQYLIIAANRDLIEKTEVLDLLASCEEGVGVNALLLFDELRNLPKECNAVIGVNDANEILVYNQNDTSGITQQLTSDISVTVDQLASVASVLANTNLNLTSQRFVLPNVLPFMEMFDVGKVEHLNAAMRWRENNPTVSLAVPVGVAANGEPFVLDLHEKVHGPHGLIAGMTGSGKSEFVITYVLSLALSFHPDEVAFVLIDYKGGGLAGAFDNEHARLPHLAGTITNLDGASIDRALVSIQSELRRRQAVFNRACEAANEGTIDIYKYQQMYRAGAVDEPMPHLFIISDEFAELKQQQPDFMDQLISTARIGRSLGVHLILATQKPNGVVNDQIRSNSKFKVCLKVQDRADSMDMINRPDAASLVETGRFYLQVGFNELFAMGQSAWAGAAYNPSAKPTKSKDNAVVVVNNLGRPVMQAKPSLGTGKVGQKKQIVAIVDYLAQTAKREGVGARPLWLPAIPADVYVDDLVAKYGWKPVEGQLEACIGELDDPENQSQRILTIPFGKRGNAVICGAAGSGKGQLLMAMLYSLLRSYDAEHLSVYVLDFGSGLLTAFRDAPQVGDVIVAEESEKVANLLKLLLGELGRRKRLFAREGVGFAPGSNGLLSMLVVLNNIAVFYELYEAFEDRLITLVREGAKYGMYFVVTELSSSDMRFRLAQNFAQSFVLHLNDEADYASFLGGGLYKKRFAGYLGRGLVRQGGVHEFQTAHPFSALRTASVETEGERITSLCLRLREESACAPAQPVPVLPEIVSPEFVLAQPLSLSGFPVGVAKGSLEIVRVNLAKCMAFMVFSNDWDALLPFELGYLEVLVSLAEELVVVLDPLSRFNDVQMPENARIVSGQSACEAYLIGEVEALDSGCSPRIVFNSPSAFFAALDAGNQTKAKNTLEKSIASGETYFTIVDTASSLGMMRFDSWVQVCTACSCGMWIGDGVAEQQIVKVSHVSNDLYAGVPSGFGYVVRKGKPILTKILSKVVAKEEDDGDE